MVQELRLRQAKLLLENTTFQINHIADEVGYTNFNHFYKKFKEQYHVTPAEYRKQFVVQRDKKP
jgi:AraC-like DNA-binding protein